MNFPVDIEEWMEGNKKITRGVDIYRVPSEKYPGAFVYEVYVYEQGKNHQGHSTGVDLIDAIREAIIIFNTGNCGGI